MSSGFWWESEGRDVWQDIFDHVRTVEEAQSELRQMNLRHARLYCNYDPPGLDWKASGTRSWRRNFTAVSENVIESVVDTATSMIAKNRPRPTFQTDGADWGQQRKAKLLEKFVWGMFQKAEVYDKAPRIFRDACVFGTGILKVFAEGDEICVERVLPDEIVVDEMECRSGCMPRQMHQRRFVDREVLKAAFPKKAAQIDLLRPQQTYTTNMQVETHQCVVIESWHLPSGEGAKDGRHCISIEGMTLFEESYAKDYFPFIFVRWNEPVTGFYGKGLAAQLVGIQLKINKLNRFIDECQELVTIPRVFMDVGGRPPKAQLTDKIGQVIPVRGGKKPEFYTAPSVPAEVFQRLEYLKRSAYELAGISQMSAQAKKPGGLESAVALREFNDIETQRFSIVAQRYEHFFLEVARHIVCVAKDMAKRGKNMTSVFYERKFMRRIPWKDVDLDEDVYTMSIEASSIMSRTPAGRLQSVTEMMQAGLINPEEGRRLLGHPDLERELDLQNAAIEDIEAAIENMLDGIVEVPEPMQNLSRGLLRVQLAYLKAQRDGAPEDRLDLMRRWMVLAQQQLSSTAAPPPGASGMAGAPNATQPAAAMAPQAMSLAPVG